MSKLPKYIEALTQDDRQEIIDLLREHKKVARVVGLTNRGEHVVRYFAPEAGLEIKKRQSQSPEVTAQRIDLQRQKAEKKKQETQKRHEKQNQIKARDAARALVLSKKKQMAASRAEANDVSFLFRSIFEMPISKLAEKIEINTFIPFIYNPDLYAPPWIRGNLIPKLLSHFPDKQKEIKFLERILCLPRTSVHKIKKGQKILKDDFYVAAGMLLKDMREQADMTIAEVQARASDAPNVQRNVINIENGADISRLLYKEAINVLSRIYVQKEPQKVGRFIPVLQRIGNQI